jgi:hypothetical protein
MRPAGEGQRQFPHSNCCGIAFTLTTPELTPHWTVCPLTGSYPGLTVGLVLTSRLVFTGGEVTIDRREWCERACLGFELGELG